MPTGINSIAKRVLGNIVKDTNAREKQTAESAPARDITQIMHSAGVPNRYLPATLEKHFSNIKPDWSKGGFCLRGMTGCGKSTLAAALLRDRFEQDELLTSKDVAWIGVLDYMSRIKSATHNQSKERPYDILQGYRKKKLLVIDDLGKQRSHDWDKSELIALIWQAYDQKQDLIITTQKKLRELDMYESALASRLSTLSDIPLKEVDRRAEP